MYETMFISLKNFFVKMIVFTSILYTADCIFPMLYPSFWAMITTSLILSIVGTIADITIVPYFKSFISLLMGFPGFILILWGVAKFYPHSHVSILAAILLTFCLGPFEYMLHKYVLNRI